MRRVSRGPVALGLAISLAAAALAGAEPPAAGAGRTIFIGKYDRPTPHKAESLAVRSAIEKLRGSFHALEPVSGYDQATYGIISPSFELSAGALELTATYSTLAGSVEATGSSREAELDSRAIAALDDFLGKTLFNPTRGPYPRIAIEQCLEKQGQLALVVSWSGGPGLEPNLAYEVSRPSPFSENLSGEKVFLDVDDLESTIEEGAGRATLVIEDLLREDGAMLDKSCAAAKLRTGKQDPGKRFLKLRLYTPKPKEVAVHVTYATS